MVVSVFFMLSGASLYYNYPKVEISRLKSFYFKRWKSLFPAFLLVWFLNYSLCVLKEHNFFYAAEPKYLLLSLVGMDGYLHHLHPNYYYAGEWFLGAIIVMYLFYPLFTRLFEKKTLRLITTVVIFVAFLWLMRFNPFLINKAWNPITCTFTFWCGMLIMEYRDFFKKNWWIKAASIIPALILLFVPLGWDTAFMMVIASPFCYLFMDWISSCIFFVPPLKSFVMLASTLSYEIFLVHHSLMNKYIDIIMDNASYHIDAKLELVFLILVLIPIFFYAKALSLIIKCFQGTKLWKTLEGFFLK